MKMCPLEEIGHGECKYHINYLEMLAVYLGLQTFAKDKAYTHIRIMMQSTALQSTLLTIWEPVI